MANGFYQIYEVPGRTDKAMVIVGDGSIFDRLRVIADMEYLGLEIVSQKTNLDSTELDSAERLFRFGREIPVNRFSPIRESDIEKVEKGVIVKWYSNKN